MMIRRKQEETFVEYFVSIIKNELDSRDMTVRELAERAGMGYPYLYRILKGDQSPTMKYVEKILNALDLSLKITQ